MRPVLLDIAGLKIYSYGLLVALAFVAAALVARRLLVRAGRGDLTLSLALAGIAGGLIGGRLYWLAEHWGESGLWHQLLSPSGFTWYGGVLGGFAGLSIWCAARRQAVGVIADAVAPAIAVGYAIGRVGCFLAGDGTYGTPSDLPWAVAFPNGIVPTAVPVHPTPLYETVAAGLIALLLWYLIKRPHRPWTVFAAFLVLTGAERFLIEFLRLNERVFASLTAAQLFALAGIALGIVALLFNERQRLSSLAKPGRARS